MNGLGFCFGGVLHDGMLVCEMGLLPIFGVICSGHWLAKWFESLFWQFLQ